MGSMPVHDPILLAKVNLDQAATTRSTSAGTRLWLVSGAMRCAYQQVPGAVKKSVVLVIHLHRHMGATVQIGVHLLLVTNSKGTAVSTTIDHIKRNCFVTVNEISRVAKEDFLPQSRFKTFTHGPTTICAVR